MLLVQTNSDNVNNEKNGAATESATKKVVKRVRIQNGNPTIGSGKTSEVDEAYQSDTINEEQDESTKL